MKIIEKEAENSQGNNVNITNTRNEKEQGFPSIRFIDLFGGIGGFSLGLERSEEERNNERKESDEQQSEERRLFESGDIPNAEHEPGGRIDPSRERIGEKETTISGRQDNNTEIDSLDHSELRCEQGGRRRAAFSCVGYYEIDKYAIQTYNKNFGSNFKQGDITKVRSEDIPEHDLLCAGFPCQSFSIAGKRGGFKDTRGTLFFEIARILRDKRPKMVLLENVKGLLSHDGGRTFGVILNTLRELGYVGQYEVLNSKNFGVPQNRERIFIFGFRGERCPKVFPLGKEYRTDEEEHRTKQKGKLRVHDLCVSQTIQTDGQMGSTR